MITVCSAFYPLEFFGIFRLVYHSNVLRVVRTLSKVRASVGWRGFLMNYQVVALRIEKSHDPEFKDLKQLTTVTWKDAITNWGM